ncbi:MAG: alpha/beta hydrolase [Nannocystaceae bacterium]
MPRSSETPTPAWPRLRLLGRLAMTATLLGGCSMVDTLSAARTRRLARRGVEARTVTLGDETLRYWSGGTGEDAVVFLHGFGGDALWQWYPELRDFAKDHRVIAPDLLWFGGSKSQVEDFSIQHQARAVRALLAYEGIDHYDLVGLSYGGMVSHELVGQDPHAVLRVILVASPARAFLAEDKAPILAELGLHSADELLLPRDADGLNRLMRLAYADPPWVPRFIGRQVVDEFYTPHRREHVAMLTNVEANTAIHRVTYAVPPTHRTLILWGHDDRVFPPRAAVRLKAELGDNAQLCVFEGSAHAPHLERKEQVIPVMRSFLDGHSIRCPTTIDGKTDWSEG